MDDSPRFCRLQKVGKRTLRRGESCKTGNSVPNRQQQRLAHKQHKRDIIAIRRVRNSQRETARQERWCEQLRFPNDEDHENQIEIEDAVSEDRSYIPGLSFSVQWDWIYELDRRFYGWDTLPGRGEYSYLQDSPCPLCGGNCLARLKQEVQDDVSGIKWRIRMLMLMVISSGTRV